MAHRRCRADELLVNQGLAPTRAKAQALVLAGDVFVGDVRVEKAGALLPGDAALTVRGSAQRYASRGGVKLEGALSSFGIVVRGMSCLDVGASTGGFTDCLLVHGAARVAAVDVGYGQLAHKLRVDPRVAVFERTNARTLTPTVIGGTVDMTVVDASFISLGKLLPAIALCTREGGTLVALIKPQFEAGREEASRGRGVIRDEGVRVRAIQSTIDEVLRKGFEFVAQCDSPIAGPKGNLEAFVYARRKAPAC